MKYQKLEGQQRFYKIPPNVQGMMCGIQYASQDNAGEITLTYTDNTTESAKCPEYDIDEKDIFFIVGDVQEKARRA